MARTDRDQIEKDWAARGFSCGLWIDPPGRVWADFVHDTDELVLLLEGARNSTWAEKRIGLKSARNF